MRCRNCFEGEVNGGDHNDYIPWDCPCCHGNWENCPECSAAEEDKEEDR